MTLDALPGWAMNLLSSERAARLAYVDDRDRPRVVPITFALAEGALWSAIDEKPKRSAEPARIRYLERRPEAALLVDVYDDDWTRLAWVQLLGRVDVVPLGDSPAAVEALVAKYEPYAERTPPGPLLRFTVERALHWRAAPAS